MLDDSVVQPFYTVDMAFDEGAVRFWTGPGDLVVGGTTYTGVGNLLKISTVEESGDLSVRGIELTLSGITSGLLALALGSQYHGRVCTLSFGALTPAGYILKEDGSFLLLESGDKMRRESLTGGLNVVFIGYMDKMDITESGESSIINLFVENKLVDLERPRNARYTQSYQQSLYPNDKGLNYVADLQDKEIVWGRSVG